MQQSEELRDAMLRFYERLSAGDVEGFDLLVSQEPATLFIGTSPGEWVTEREKLRSVFEAEGVRLAAEDPKGYEEGSLGWVVDRPTFYFADGSPIHTRLTAVLRREEDGWKLVHAHYSVGVPDEEVVELQGRWSAEEAGEAR